MANTKISALPAGIALGGTEVGPFVQSAATVKVTATQIKTFTSASPTLVTPSLGVATATSLAVGGGAIGSALVAAGGNTSSDDSAYVAARSATNPLESGGSHAFRDESIYQQSSQTGGYASFDAIAQMQGSGTENHFRAFQARPNIGVSVTLPLLEGFFYQPNLTGAGTVSASYGLHVYNAQGSMALTTQYGVYIDSLTRGSNNYGFYNAGAAPNNLGSGLTVLGSAQITGAATAASLALGGATLGADVLAVTGSFTASSTVKSGSSTFALGSNGFLIGSGNGVFGLYNAAASDFGRLQFGGATTSFPAIKRDGTAVRARLANDSADTGVIALYFQTIPVAVASLPSASGVGAGSRGFVSDALAPTFGATVVGSGAVPIPVYSDGTNWKVG